MFALWATMLAFTGVKNVRSYLPSIESCRLHRRVVKKLVAKGCCAHDVVHRYDYYAEWRRCLMPPVRSGRQKICFVGLDNYPVLNPDCGGEYFGGESVQQTLLAKAFADLGYEVSMVVKDHGQAQGEFRQGSVSGRPSRKVKACRFSVLLIHGLRASGRRSNQPMPISTTSPVRSNNRLCGKIL